jgi:hypothetical protein
MRGMALLIALLGLTLLATSCSCKVTTGDVQEAGQPGASAVSRTDAESEEAPDEAGETETAAPDEGGLEDPAAAPSAEGVQISVGEGYDSASAEVTDETTSFATDAPEIHIGAELTGLTAGQTIKATLRAVEVTDSQGNVIRDHDARSADVTAIGERTPVHFTFSVPDAGWPVGSYDIRLAVEEEVVGTAPITVE